MALIRHYLGDVDISGSMIISNTLEVGGAKVVPSLLYGQTSVQGGDTIASSDTEVNFASSYTVPANSLEVGDVLKVSAAYVHSTTGNPNMTHKLKFGSTVLGSTGAASCGNNESDDNVLLFVNIVVISLGATGSFEVQGYHRHKDLGLSMLVYKLLNTAVVTVNTTIAQALQASWQWGTSSALNTIVQRQFVINRYRS